MKESVRSLESRVVVLEKRLTEIEDRCAKMEEILQIRSVRQFRAVFAPILRLASNWEEEAAIRRNYGQSYIAVWLDNCARDLRLEIAHAEAWATGSVAHSMEKTNCHDRR